MNIIKNLFVNYTGDRLSDIKECHPGAILEAYAVANYGGSYALSVPLKLPLNLVKIGFFLVGLGQGFQVFHGFTGVRGEFPGDTHIF